MEAGETLEEGVNVGEVVEQLSEEVQLMEVTEEVLSTVDPDASEMEVEVTNDMIYEEIVQEIVEIPQDDGEVEDVSVIMAAETEPDNDKENAESDVGEGDFPEDADAEAIVEITRRRISQDREGNCYCGKDRNLNIAELLCASCNRWYHESCIGYQLGKLVPFMTNYVFMCKNCSPTGLETFKRSQAQFNQMCVTALANLHQASVKEGINKKMFSKDRDIIPFFEMHWDALTTTTRRVTSSWHLTLFKALQKDVGSVFTLEEKADEPGQPCFGLFCSDLTLIKPSYENMIKSGHLKVTESGSASSMRGRGAKRRNILDNSSGGQGALAKKTRGDFFPLKMLPGHGYPPDHPYNKDNFRYLLAEPDPNAPFRQEFDESSDWAGKPIPGWLYRVLVPCSVLLALHDRAPQLKVSEDRLSVTGDKGYSMVRSTHGVNKGSWYFEAQITDFPDGAATRIGFGHAHANLQGPLGYDKFGYSWRSRYGTAFHQAKGKSYAKGGYGLGDTLGFLIILPEETSSSSPTPESLKDKPLVRFKSHLYYEEKDSVAEAAKKNDVKVSLPIHKGSKIICFKNGIEQGVMFENLFAGTYFPAISVYRSATAKMNYGPEFWAPPSKDCQYKYRGMYEKAELAIVEQTIADLLFLTENDGKLTLDNINMLQS